MTKQHRRQLFAWLFAAQRGQCVYCRCLMEQGERYMGAFAQAPTVATFDHVKPKSAGGQDVDDNVVLACHECNQAKGSDWRDRRSGPTPEQTADLCGDLRIQVKSHLYELERMLVTAGSGGLPKAKKEAIWLTHKFWERELVESQNLPKHIISHVQNSGLYLRDKAVADCWEPIYAVDVFHTAPNNHSSRYRHSKRNR